MAGQLGFQDLQLPEPSDELRVFGLSDRIFNRLVEAAEHLLERIVVAFAVAAGKIGIGPRAVLQ